MQAVETLSPGEEWETSTHRAAPGCCALQDCQSLPSKKGRFAQSNQALRPEISMARRQREDPLCCDASSFQDRSRQRMSHCQPSRQPPRHLILPQVCFVPRLLCHGMPFALVLHRTRSSGNLIHRLCNEDGVQGRVSIWWLNVLLTHVLTTAPS